MTKIKLYIVEGTELHQLPAWIKSPQKIGSDTVEGFVFQEDLAAIFADSTPIPRHLRGF